MWRGALLVFVLPADIVRAALRKSRSSQDAPDIADGAAQIAVLQARGQRHHQPLVFARELVGSAHFLDARKRRERHNLFGGRDDGKLLDAREVVAEGIRKPDADADGVIADAKR